MQLPASTLSKLCLKQIKGIKGLCSVCTHIASKACPFVLLAHLSNGNTALRQCNTLGMIAYVRACVCVYQAACAVGQFVISQMSGWVIHTQADRRRPGSRGDCHLRVCRETRS